MCRKQVRALNLPYRVTGYPAQIVGRHGDM